MKVSEAFPSNYLKADDLCGNNTTVTIASSELEEIGQGRDQKTKLVLSFVGKKKKMVLNKTNANTISKLYGDDTDEWVGERIILTAREVEFQGDMVLALRVSLQKPSQQVASQAPSNRQTQRAPMQPADQDGEIETPDADGNIPF